MGLDAGWGRCMREDFIDALPSSRLEMGRYRYTRGHAQCKLVNCADTNCSMHRGRVYTFVRGYGELHVSPDAWAMKHGRYSTRDLSHAHESDVLLPRANAWDSHSRLHLACSFDIVSPSASNAAALHQTETRRE